MAGWHRASAPVIGFLTDFGLDGAAATCRGRHALDLPDAQIVDICHTVRKYAIRDGAFVLRAALPYLPIGVHLAVVDPGVGTDRRADRHPRRSRRLPRRPGQRPAAARLPMRSAASTEARELANSRPLAADRRARPSTGGTSSRRSAAHLAAGNAVVRPTSGRRSLRPSLVRLPAGAHRATPGRLETEVTYVDSFGNLRLAGGAD